MMYMIQGQIDQFATKIFVRFTRSIVFLRFLLKLCTYVTFNEFVFFVQWIYDKNKIRQILKWYSDTAHAFRF